MSFFEKSDPPPAPDYAGAARSQGAASLQAAIANSILNRPQEVTPYGTRSWSQTGSFGIPGAEGNPAVDIPTFTSNINFTPDGAALYAADTNLKKRMASLGDTAMTGVNTALSSPMNFEALPKMYNEADLTKNRQEVEDALYRRQTAMLDPQWSQAKEARETELMNRGFSMQPGQSGGYDTAMADFGRQKQNAYGDARDRSILAGGQEQSRLFSMSQADRQQAIQEMLLKRTQPIQELNAIRTGAMPSVPTFQNFSANSNAQAAPTFAAAQAQGQAAVDNYNAEQAGKNSMLSGLFQLGSAWIGA